MSSSSLRAYSRRTRPSLLLLACIVLLSALLFAPPAPCFAQSESLELLSSSAVPSESSEDSTPIEPSSSAPLPSPLPSSSAPLPSSSAPLPSSSARVPSSSAPIPSSSAPVVPATLSVSTSSDLLYELVISPASNDPARRLVLNASTALLSGDDEVAFVSLGMSFPFYGVRYNSMNVSTNGNLQFSSNPTNSFIPSAFGTAVSKIRAPFIAMLWDDLVVSSSNPIRYQLLGATPDRILVLRYDNVTSFGTVGTGSSFDVLLYEATGAIEVRYFHVTAWKVTQSAQIGLYRSSNDWVSVWNGVPFDATGAAAFTNVTLKYTPAPPRQHRALSPRHGPTSSYDAAHVSAVSNELLHRTLPLTPLTSTPADDGLYTWTLPFAFRIGSITTSTVTVSTNGNLQFGGRTSYRFVPEPLPKGDGELLPLLSYLFTDISVTSAAQFEIGVLGNTTLERVALLRMQAAGTASNRTAASSIDVLLFEGVNRIEVRYYNVGVYSETTLIALQNVDVRDFVVFWNAQVLTNDARSLLSGSTIVLQPRMAFSSDDADEMVGSARARRLRRRLLSAMV